MRRCRLSSFVVLLLLVTPVLAADGPLRTAESARSEAVAERVSPAGSAAASGPSTAASGPAAEQGRASAVQLQPMLVTAVDAGAVPRRQRRLTPGAVRIVAGDDLRARAVSNVADALRYVPGVLAVSDAGADSGVLSVRGSDLTALNYVNAGVQLYQNGLPVSSADGANHNRLINPLAAYDVVVAKGANALTWGASTLGGAINVISRNARNSNPRQAYLYGASEGMLGGRVSVGGVGETLDAMLTLGGKHFSGWRAHSRENRSNLHGNVGWRVSDDLQLRLYATAINARQQLAGSLTRAEYQADPLQAAPAYAWGKHQLNVKTARLAATGQWRIDGQSSLEFGFSREKQSLYHPIVDVVDFSTTPPSQYFSLLIDSDQHTSGGMLRYHYQGDQHDVLLGLNLARTHNVGSDYENKRGQRGARSNDLDQRADNMTVFALDRWAFAPRWTLVYGAQGVTTDRDLHKLALDSHQLRRQQATYRAINPRMGLIRQLGTTSEAFASLSRVYQPPTSYALDNDVRASNATLDAMHGIAWEAGVRGHGRTAAQGNSWHWSLALYRARIRNEILSVEDPAQPGTMLSTNYAATIHAGVEALLGGSFALADSARRIEPLVSLSWNDFHFDADPVYGGNDLPYAPDYTVHGEVLYRHRASGFSIGPTFDLVGGRYADMANSYRVDGHVLVGLRVGVRRAGWELFAEARNLADKRYVDSVAVRTQAAADARVLNLGAPRSLFVGMRLQY